MRVRFVPWHPPDHATNRDPAAGAAVTVTAEKLGNTAEQTLPQLIRLGSLVTVPDPFPPWRR